MHTLRKMKEIKTEVCPTCRKKHRTFSEVESCLCWVRFCYEKSLAERKQDMLVLYQKTSMYAKGYVEI
jgi:hypothetical protein